MYTITKNHLRNGRQIKHSEGVAFDVRKQTWMQFNKWMSKSCTHLWCSPRLITPTHVVQHINNYQKGETMCVRNKIAHLLEQSLEVSQPFLPSSFCPCHRPSLSLLCLPSVYHLHREEGK